MNRHKILLDFENNIIIYRKNLNSINASQKLYIPNGEPWPSILWPLSPSEIPVQDPIFNSVPKIGCLNSGNCSTLSINNMEPLASIK